MGMALFSFALRQIDSGTERTRNKKENPFFTENMTHSKENMT